MRHRQRRLSAETAFGLGGSVPDGCEGGLDAVLGQAFHRPVVFHAVNLNGEIEGGVSGGLGFSQPDVLQVRLGLRLHRFRHLFITFTVL